MLVTWQFRIRNSLMEAFDPRARWIFSLVFLFSVTMFWDIRFLAVFFGVAALWFASSRVTLRETRRAWTLILFLLFMMVVVNTLITSGGSVGIVTGEGHSVIHLDGRFPVTGWHIHFNLTVERLWFALAQVLRVLGISAVFVVIPYSMDPRLYGFTFRGLGFPDRFAYSMDLAFRYVPTLARDFGVTMDAQKARGYEIERVEGGLLAQIGKVAPLIVPITMSSILSGEDVTNAMDLRCFGMGPRTWVEKTFFQRRDWVLLAFSAVMLIGSILLRYAFHLGEFWVPGWILPG